MTIDRSYRLGVGWIIEEGMIPASMKKEVAEVFRMENRFHPKTGEKLQPEKVVVSEASTTFILDGVEVDDIDSFMEMLVAKIHKELGIKCETSSFGNWVCGEYYNTIELDLSNGCSDDVSAKDDGSIDFNWLHSQKGSFDMIAGLLESYGIHVGDPKIMLQETIS